MTKTLPLPNIIDKNEKLARVICTGESNKSYKKKVNANGEIKPGLFVDTRNPATLSVNRISTLSIKESHELGIDHQRKYQPKEKYYGFAKILAQYCFEANCDVVKDDNGGTQPYHANIIYPYENKQDVLLIAVTLAKKSKFFKFSE